MRHVKTVEIRWRDIDAFGHVNNAVFLTYLEGCRDEWLARASGDDEALWRFVVRRIEIDYRSQIRQADGAVEVAVELDRVGTSSVVTRERMHAGADGRLVAEATAVLVHLDEARTAASPLPAALAARIAGAATAP